MTDDPDITALICRFIYNNWIVTAKSQRDFAATHDIEESTARRIKNIALGTAKGEYNMTIKTLHKMCRIRKITLEDFFGLLKE